MLTPRDAVEDRIRGLDGDADDYLTKPFSFGELCARVCAQLRRGQGERPAPRVGDLTMDPAARRAWRGEGELVLSTGEFALLAPFLRHPGEVLTRSAVLEHVWEFAYDGVSNIIGQDVSYLRRKIDRHYWSGRVPSTSCGPKPSTRAGLPLARPPRPRPLGALGEARGWRRRGLECTSR